MVDPQFLYHKQLTTPMCMEGFPTFIEKRFPGDVAKQTAAVASLSALKNGDGVFGREAAKLAAQTMPAYRWLEMYCFQEPELQQAGGELCSLFTMQSGSERIYKMEEFRTKLSFAAICIEKYEKREKDLLHPIHFAAYLVDPQFLDHKQLTTPLCAWKGFSPSSRSASQATSRNRRRRWQACRRTRTATVCSGVKQRN
jgi:hypothetical protein